MICLWGTAGFGRLVWGRLESSGGRKVLTDKEQKCCRILWDQKQSLDTKTLCKDMFPYTYSMEFNGRE